MLTAHNIFKEKIWTVEENGQKIALLQYVNNSYSYKPIKIGSTSESFNDLITLKKKYKIKFLKSPRTKKIRKLEQNLVYGFLAGCTPFNEVFEIKRGIPLFTKTKKSKSKFCAGYYLLNVDHQWIIEFNPKLITLNNYQFKGPFKSIDEADANKLDNKWFILDK